MPGWACLWTEGEGVVQTLVRWRGGRYHRPVARSYICHVKSCRPFGERWLRPIQERASARRVVNRVHAAVLRATKAETWPDIDVAFIG